METVLYAVRLQKATRQAMGRGVEIKGKRSGNPRNPAAMIEAYNASAMDAKILQPLVAKNFNAPTHTTPRPPLAHASEAHGRLPAPIGEVGGQIIMKGGCRCLVCVGKEISLAKQHKASTSTAPILQTSRSSALMLPPSGPNALILPPAYHLKDLQG